jgi:PAS domain S-box-containing protein
MFEKINYFFFQKYENSDFITQQRVKVLLQICLTLMFVVFAMTVFIIVKGEKDLGMILPVLFGGFALIVCTALIKYGYFNIAAYTVLVVSSSVIWIAMVTQSSTKTQIERLDSVAMVIGFMTFTALLVSKRSAVIIGYTIANILLFIGCTLYIQQQMKITNAVMFDYMIATLIGMVSAGVGSLLIFTINKRALQKADDATKIAEFEEEKFAEFFLKSPIPMAITAMKDGRFVDVNEAFAKVMSRQREELMDNTSIDAGYITAEQRAIFLDEYRRKGFVENLELQIRVKGGDLRDGLFNSLKVTIGKEKFFLTQVTDITERKLAEAKLKQTLDSLKNAVGTTIHVLASAVEARDPYTSGHQLRSADLARAIATEIGLAQDKIEGIRMAGSIHDIGKLSIPAEILSKPTKLTNIEFSLIKEHSRIGYEMLKEVESPWPLAQIVYQHHERMNGSGYPRNLKGNEILMESRILAVADVVEAMASHRPYRSTLGIEAALEEIEKNKGILYDDTVADACLRLFRKKGYQLA